MSPAGILLTLGIFAVVGGLAFYFAAKRRKELSEWAGANGLTFDPGKDHQLGDRFGHFRVFGQGRDRYASNIMQGRWAGKDVLAFDYHYTTGSGKSRQTHTFSAVILVSGVPLNPLLIRPEGFGDKVAEFFGADDIDFESSEFSRRFFVKSGDRKWAYDVIHPRMMEFLLSAGKFHIEMGLIHVLVYRSACFGPRDYTDACHLAAGILDRLPGYLVRQQGNLQ
ncbi:MAG: hypothetical protein WC869_04620 [Phycisphaerae bacterium]|jgi:hypothetical protein